MPHQVAKDQFQAKQGEVAHLFESLSTLQLQSAEAKEKVGLLGSVLD
jgi:hypothetical protein